MSVKLGFIGVNLVSLCLIQNIDCEYTLEPVLTSTHILMFGAEIREKTCPCIAQFCYMKVGPFKGILVTRTCFPDGPENLLPVHV